MSGVLLDTSAYSAFRNGDAPAVEVVRVADRVCFTPVVLGELRAGFASGTRRAQNEQALNAFLMGNRIDILTIDAETSAFYAAISLSLRSSGTPIPTNDMWIAATAMQHGLELVTFDRDFLNVNQVIVRYLGD